MKNIFLRYSSSFIKITILQFQNTEICFSPNRFRLKKQDSELIKIKAKLYKSARRKEVDGESDSKSAR